MEKEVIQDVIEGRIANEPMQVIADRNGIGVGTVWKIANKDEIRKIIEDGQQKFLQECIPSAVESAVNLVKNYDTLKKYELYGEDYKFNPEKEHAFRLIEKSLAGIGILPSNNTSVVFQNCFNINNNSVVDPLVANILKNVSSRQVNVGVEEAKIIDDSIEKIEYK